jgi:hypothetical protein
MGVVQDNSIFPPPTAELPESIWMGARYVTDTWMSFTGGKYFTAPALTGAPNEPMFTPLHVSGYLLLLFFLSWKAVSTCCYWWFRLPRHIFCKLGQLLMISPATTILGSHTVQLYSINWFFPPHDRTSIFGCCSCMDSNVLLSSRTFPPSHASDESPSTHMNLHGGVRYFLRF